MDTTVAVTRCEGYEGDKLAEAIGRQFSLLGGAEVFFKRGDSVLLKPNFIAPRSRRHATQTHPEVLLAVARLLKDFGARPFVGDSPAWGNVFACVRELGLEEGLAKLGVPVQQLDRPKWCEVGAEKAKVGISEVALGADVIVNLPKFKTHQQLVATFAVKNMFGCVAGKRKALWHFRRGKTEEFCKLLIEIYSYLRPVVTIVDGIAAMDGRGPIRGRDRKLGWLIGGRDPIACEIICSELVNIELGEVPIIRTAEQMGYGFGNRDEIEVVGDDYSDNICMDFELPEPVPVRFSLVHVCKSICKQIVLLAKSAAGRKKKATEDTEK